MITEMILDKTKVFLVWIMSLMPDLSNLGIVRQFDGFLEVCSFAFYFIPMAAVVSCIGVIFVLQHADFIFGGITWLLRRIPGQG